MRQLAAILITLLIIVFLSSIMLEPLIRQMLYPAPQVPLPSPPPAPLVEVALALPSGEPVTAWERRHAEPAGPAVVFFHGNGDNLETMRLSGFYDELAGLGVHLLAVEYPGYGGSTVSPSEASLTAAGEAGLAWLAARYPESPKVVLGWSLGAAVAAQVARRHDAEIDGLVLLSPWADLPSLAAVHYPSWLVGLGLRDTYDSVAAAAQVGSPVLMIHGAADRIIPVEQGRRLHQAFAESCRFVEVPTAGHNDLLSRRVVWQELGAFLGALAPGRAPG